MRSTRANGQPSIVPTKSDNAEEEKARFLEPMLLLRTDELPPDRRRQRINTGTDVRK